MEGNDIEDLGGGSFRTNAAVQRYSRLDQYAMGLVPPSQVATFFYVDNPTNVAGGREADSAPRVGVTFNGTRRDVLIDDVIAVMGARVPSSTDSPRVHRQAFLLVVGRGRSVRQFSRDQARSHSSRLGAVFPAGDRGPDAGGDEPAVSLHPSDFTSALSTQNYCRSLSIPASALLLPGSISRSWR